MAEEKISTGSETRVANLSSGSNTGVGGTLYLAADTTAAGDDSPSTTYDVAREALHAGGFVVCHSTSGRNGW